MCAQKKCVLGWGYLQNAAGCPPFVIRRPCVLFGTDDSFHTAIRRVARLANDLPLDDILVRRRDVVAFLYVGLQPSFDVSRLLELENFRWAFLVSERLTKPLLQLWYRFRMVALQPPRMTTEALVAATVGMPVTNTI